MRRQFNYHLGDTMSPSLSAFPVEWECKHGETQSEEGGDNWNGGTESQGDQLVCGIVLHAIQGIQPIPRAFQWVPRKCRH